MTAPTLDDLIASITFAENTVNMTPQLLDADVTLVDPDDDWDGGTLTLTGILVEDTVSIQNVGGGAGEVGLSGTNVTFAGVTIGTLLGGNGTDLTITFNASATTAMVEAVIENMTYANSSDTPTATRDFRLNVTDAEGDDLGGGAQLGFTNAGVLTGANNPFDGIDVGISSTPSFVDIDGDGDLDLVSGERTGIFRTYENDGGVYTELSGAENPLNGLDAGAYSATSFADVDGDGDLDLVAGFGDGKIYTFENDGGVYTQLSNAENPFDGIDVGTRATPSFVDLDGDGDIDLVSGAFSGKIWAYENNGGAFTQIPGAQNPFRSIDVGTHSAPSFIDFDGDGDLDLVVGEHNGTLLTYENDGGMYAELSGAANPFDGIDAGFFSMPSFVDLDGDGDFDLLSGGFSGNFSAYLNEGPAGQTVTVSITAENDAPTIGIPAAITVIEDDGPVAITDLSVADAEDAVLTITLSAEGILALGLSTGLTFTNGDGSAASTMTFSGSVADINAALATLTYAPASNDDDGDSIEISVTDGTQILTPGTFAATFELSSLLAANGGNGSTGFVLNGIDASDFSGGSVSSAGDVNGDGIDDLIIGVLGGDPNGSASGESYIVFGSSAGFGTTFELSSLASGDGSTGFVLNGIDANDQSGRSVSSAGDVNGDGIDDLLIAAFAANPNGNGGAGESYVVFGSSAGFGASFDLSALANGDGSTGFVLNGIDAEDFSGISVSSAGDVNGDGIEDLIVGATGGDPNGNGGAGESYVVFGASATFGASFDLTSLASGNGSTGFVLNGIDAGDSSGGSVSSAGDVNGDGIDDLIIGATGGDPNGSASGETYIVFGSSAGFGTSFELSSLASGDGSTGFVLNGIDAGDVSGRSVASAGDVNGDGIDDLIIGANGGDPNGISSGETYVVFGSSAGFGASFELSSLASGDGSTGFVLNGIEYKDFSGSSISSAGDVNGDGIDDLIIGAGSADPNGNVSGESYVVFGSSAGFGATFELSSLASGDGSTGFVLNGIDKGDQSGSSVSSAGDVNGDGIDDLIIGATGGDPNGFSGAGESYVVYGRANFSDVLVNGSLTVNITPVNDAPTLSGDLAGSVNDGAAYVLTAADLFASDVDDATSALVFTVSNVVNGTVLLNGAATMMFTQADIDAGFIRFRHDASTAADGSFDVTVADGELATSAVLTVTMTALGPVVMDGTPGVDDLDGTDANDFIRGLDSNDRIDGFDGNDQLFGNAGDDTLVAGDGDDILNGGNGDDRLFGGAGADFMDGRGGFDLASYKTATSAIVLDLTNGANNTGDAAGDTFANIAAFEGTRFNDTMTGDANTNRMFGLDGEDTLNGGGANDRLLGGDGNDTLNGDDGADLLYGDDGDDILNGGNGRDVLVGGDGADTFNGGADIDRVTYKPSDTGVTINLTNAANSTGDALGDTFNSIELVEGSQFNDIFIGTDLRDRLFGLDGVDLMAAGAGNDLLEGGNGNDILDGGADADILRGGAGDDTLAGGAGKDRFQFGANEGADTITDFNQSELDRMQFTDASGVEVMADLTIVQLGNDTLITYAEGSILLEDFTATDLGAGDFSFL